MDTREADMNERAASPEMPKPNKRGSKNKSKNKISHSHSSGRVGHSQREYAQRHHGGGAD